MKKRIILIKQHVVLNVSCNTTRAPYPENQNPIPDCTRKLKARSIGTPQLGGGEPSQNFQEYFSTDVRPIGNHAELRDPEPDTSITSKMT